MKMYVNYYDRKVKLAEESSTIGVILCNEENNSTIFAKEYPSKEELKRQIG